MQHAYQCGADVGDAEVSAMIPTAFENISGYVDDDCNL
jgi:hypothetical protein